MKKQNIIALIECETLEKSFAEKSAGLPKQSDLKKAFAVHQSAKAVLCKRFPEVEMAEDWEAIFTDESIDLVLISAPPEKQRPLISAALRARKSVQVV